MVNWNLGKLKLVWVKREFESTKFKLASVNDSKMVSNPSDFVGVSREFELIGFYCIHSLKSDDLKAINCGCELNQCDLTFFSP